MWILQIVAKQQGSTDMIYNWKLKQQTDILPRLIKLYDGMWGKKMLATDTID